MAQLAQLATQIEQIQELVRQLTGAVNAHIEQFKVFEQRITKLEQAKQIQENLNVSTLPTPQNEQDLKDISKLPDCVKELQVFDCNPVQYVSWVHNETILKDYEIVRSKPIYRAILQSIRQKIRGTADAALISYNIFNDDWTAIKQCLSLHYADKRDLCTLEHQLSNLTQKNMSIDEFYANVNHQFSLIVNKIKTENYSTDTVNSANAGPKPGCKSEEGGQSAELTRIGKPRKPGKKPHGFTTK